MSTGRLNPQEVNMFSLRACQTLRGLIRANANTRRRGRSSYLLGLALAAGFVVGAGVGMTRAMRDVAATSVTSVPAASYEQVSLAPGSIIAAFGVNLATQVAFAISDDDPDTPGIQLPTRLGG